MITQKVCPIGYSDCWLIRRIFAVASQRIIHPAHRSLSSVSALCRSVWPGQVRSFSLTSAYALLGYEEQRGASLLQIWTKVRRCLLKASEMTLYHSSVAKFVNLGPLNRFSRHEPTTRLLLATDFFLPPARLWLTHQVTS